MKNSNSLQSENHAFTQSEKSGPSNWDRTAVDFKFISRLQGIRWMKGASLGQDSSFLIFFNILYVIYVIIFFNNHLIDAKYSGWPSLLRSLFPIIFFGHLYWCSPLNYFFPFIMFKSETLINGSEPNVTQTNVMLI